MRTLLRHRLEGGKEEWLKKEKGPGAASFASTLCGGKGADV
jgi:hypothetical protein